MNMDYEARNTESRYAYDFTPRTITHDDLQKNPELLDTFQVVTGRLVGTREHKQSTFIDIQDPSGVVQVIKDDQTRVTGKIGAGDIVTAGGLIVYSQNKQLSLRAETIDLLAPAQNRLPKQTSTDAKIEKRYLDLLVNKDSRQLLVARSAATQAVRTLLYSKGIIEVETPIVNTFYNGGVAKPFPTQLHALDTEAFLRVTSELYLKKLVIAGLERVFEITKQFRNEGLGSLYNPEFTVCEVYCAYEDHDWIMDTVEELSDVAADAANQVLSTSEKPEATYDFSHWQRLTMQEAVFKYLHDSGQPVKNIDEFMKLADAAGIKNTYPFALQNIFKKHVEKSLLKPTFITHLPAELTPMAKRDKYDDSTVNKIMFYVNGIQIGDGCYEENDYNLQQQNFIEQAQRHSEQGFAQYPRDPDFLDAVAYGMPPTSGIAIGFDRLIMAVTGSKHIREVLTFRPKRLPKK